jgi:hypothetical protein
MHQELNDLREQRDIIIPIDWNDILNYPDAKFTPRSIREFIAAVVNKMNKHFAIFVTGNNNGKLQVTHQQRLNDALIVDIMSIERAKTLFTRRLHAKWTEQGKSKKIFKSVIDIFVHYSSHRKEIYEPPIQALAYQSPVKKWLATQLLTCPSLCPIIFGALNARKIIYDTFLEEVNIKQNWSIKRICNQFYNSMPSTKPDHGKRIRRGKISMMWIPSRSYCEELLKNWQIK